MNKTFVKIISILLVAVLCLGLAACKKNDNAKNGSADSEVSVGQAINDAGDYYEYRTSYEKLSVDLDGGFFAESKIEKDKIVGLVSKYDMETQQTGWEYLEINLSDKAEKWIELSAEDLMNRSFPDGISINEDGSLYILFSQYDYSESGPSKSNHFVYKFGTDGKGEMMYSLEDFFDDPNLWIAGLCFTKEGELIFSVENTVYKVSTDGRLVGKIDVGTWINSLFLDEDSEVYAVLFDYNSGENCVKKLDFNAGAATSSFAGLDISGKMEKTPDGKFFVYDDIQAGIYDPQEKKTTTLWKWIDLDMQSSPNGNVVCLDDGTYKFICENYTDTGKTTYEIATIEKVLVTKDNAKKEIVIGCLNSSWELKEKVIEFNKTSTDYRVKINSYAEAVTTEEEYNSEKTRFDTDLAAGTSFDIAVVDFTNYYSYAKKGAFADLGKFMEQDSEIKRSDFFENVLDSYQVDGKDYAVIPSVEIYTMAGSKAVFGDKTSWTLKEMLELRKQNMDKPFLEYPSRINAFEMPFIFSFNKYVDYETGKCDFANQDFYDLLEYAKSFPEKADYDYNSWEGMRNGDVLIADVALSDFSTLTVYKQLFPQGIQIIGAPTSEGNGHLFASQYMYTILDKSENKELCWDFLKDLITDSVYETMNYGGFPTYKKGFDEFVKNAMHVNTYTNENGEVVVASIGTWSNGEEEVEVYPPSQEDIDLIKGIFESTTYGVNIDMDIITMVEEECEPFFHGQKSAEDVAAIIQSRIGIYLAENN